MKAKKNKTKPKNTNKKSQLRNNNKLKSISLKKTKLSPNISNNIQCKYNNIINIGIDLGYNSPCICIEYFDITTNKRHVNWYTIPQRYSDANLINHTIIQKAKSTLKLNNINDDNLYSTVFKFNSIYSKTLTIDSKHTIKKVMNTYKTLSQIEKITVIIDNLYQQIRKIINEQLKLLNSENQSLTINFKMESYAIGSNNKSLSMLCELGGALKYKLQLLKNELLNENNNTKHPTTKKSNAKIIFNFYELSPSTIKKQFNGYGHAKKIDMFITFNNNICNELPKDLYPIILQSKLKLLKDVITKNDIINLNTSKRNLDNLFLRKPLQDIIDSYAIMTCKKISKVKVLL